MTIDQQSMTSSDAEIAAILDENSREPQLQAIANALQHGALQMWAAVLEWVRAHPRLSNGTLATGLFAIALWSRYRFVFGEYSYTFGTGDSHMILTKALFLREGILQPSVELVPITALFDQPPLIPLLFGGVSYLTSLSLGTLPFIIVPLLTGVALVAYFDLIRRTFDTATAAIATVLLALLPRFSFNSTEPEKAPFVVSFAIISLWLVACSRERRSLLLLAGLFLGLSAFSHTTGFFFIPVYIISYFAVYGFSMRKARDPIFLLSLAIPMFFILGYFFLAKLDQPAASAGIEAGEAGFLPAFVQIYVDATWNLVTDGITERAWNLYFDAIRQQLTTPVYIAAIGGFILATVMMIRSRTFLMLPIAAWMVIVTLGFAVQYPASSHGGRYPDYVTPAFLVMAAFFLVTTVRWLVSQQTVRVYATPVIAGLVIALFGLPVYSYATSDNPGLRDLYGGHRDLAEYLIQEQLLDDGSHILYLGWPSITLYLLEENIEYQDQIHSFGFGLRDLDEFTPEFIRENNIRYFADNHIANDGRASSEIVLANLSENFRLQQIGRFERRQGNYITLYQLEETTPFYQDLLQSSLAQIGNSAILTNILVNPELRWDSDTGLLGWSTNGRVDLSPAPGSDAAGVFVDNGKEFGGIRQVFDARFWRARTMTVIASVRTVGLQPANSGVLSLAEDGKSPFNQVFVPLQPGENLIAMEAQIPEDIVNLRITIATGKDDTGDIIIETVYLIAEPLDRIVDLLQGGQ